MKYTLIALQLSILLFSGMLHAEIDLEDMSQEFVLDTKRLEIPGYPHAFNPSIIRWQGRLLMSFRDLPYPHTSFTASFISQFGLVWLDENFDPIGLPQLLITQDKNSLIPPRSEDARLIAVGEKLYMVYSDNKDEKISKGGFRVYIAQLEYDGKEFSVHNIEGLLRFEGESNQVREKNWTPFSYCDQLLLAYSLVPHKILRPLIGTGECETFSSSDKDIAWDWGVLRGGTQGLVVDGKEYLTFFHSCKKMSTVHSSGAEILHYFMGAYTFSIDPPFEITAVSPEPIVGKGFYHGPIYKPYWHPVRAIFPCGFIFDDSFIWIAYGRQDHEIWIVKLDKEGLMRSLIPLSKP